MDRADLAAALFDAVHLEGTFVLRSGVTTSRYFDKYRFESDPRLLTAIAEHAAALVPADTELLAGLELGGVPVATALSLRTGIAAAFVRKQAKEYGTRRLVEGGEVAGRRVLVVEDVVTSGGQVAVSTAELRALGAVVTTALCVVDRGEGGAEHLGEHDLTLHSLFTAAELDRGAPG